MYKFLDWLKSRKVNFYLCIAAIIAGAIALIVYLAAGRTQFDPDYSVRAIGAFIAGIVIGIAALVFPRKELIFLEYLAFFFAFLCFITSQMNMLANILYDVDGSSLPVPFEVIVILSLIAFVLPLIACFLTKDRAAAGEPDKVGGKDE